MNHEKSCGAVIKKDDTYLILKHRHGHWDFPKGHVENNEKEKETVKREVKEETNLDITIKPGFRETITYEPRQNVTKDVVFYLAEPHHTNVELQKSEISDYKWKPYQEALQLLTYKNNKDVLKKAKNFEQFQQF